jgi:hypothetical protein
MKHLAVFLMAASLAPAAEFANGQGARLLIGQRTFTAQSPTSSDVVLGAVSGLAYTNRKLFVADSNRVGATPENNRVLIFDLPQVVQDPAMPLPQGDRCPACVGRAAVVVGQPEFTKFNVALSQTGLRQPTGVASDGTRLIVSDTDNNRVLIWNSIPASNGAPADVVLGQPNFTTNFPSAQENGQAGDPRVPSARSLRGPQGVWIQNGKLFVADAQNHRVLIWNSIPTSNFQPADVVLGQPSFNTALEPDLTKSEIVARANTLLNPVSVTSDGVRLYVADLGHNRVLIWDAIPTANQQPATWVVGQPDMESAIPNNVTKLCEPKGNDDNGNPFYPGRCLATLDFPRFVLSDGQRLFIADGGNDRVLVFNSIPARNGAAADVVIGQINGEVNLSSDNANPLGKSSADSFLTPMSLAWDGVNLFVSDPIHRRVLVFTVGSPTLPITAVRNAASLDIFAVGTVSFGGSVAENDEITITIQDREYKYKVLKDETFADVMNALAAAINADSGDPAVLAAPNVVLNAVVLTSRVPGEEGNLVDYAVTVSEGSQISTATSGPTLSGGQDAAKIAPGTLVTLLGTNLAETSAGAPMGADPLPKELAGVEVYFDGIQAPLLFVGPDQINAQVPWDVNDASSINAYVRTRRSDGTVTVSTAVAVPIIPANPGIFAAGGTDPRPGVVLHGSSQASGTVSVDGIARAGDVANVTIEDRTYSYTVQEGDDLAKIRDALVERINEDPKVYAFPAGLFTRIRLRARVEGPAGNDIPYSAIGQGEVILTATTQALCCANVAGGVVTEQNPARPGETIIVLATGLGFVEPEEAKFALDTGSTYKGPAMNTANVFVSSLAGARTANVLFAGLKQGAVGLYEVHLELNSDLPTNPATQLTIAQDIFVSNIITVPVYNPNPREPVEAEP